MLYYRIIPKKDPRDEKLVKYYGVLRRGQVCDEPMLAELISQRCTVKPADVRGVLVAMQEELVLALLNSEIIEFGILGRFRMGSEGTGQNTPEEVDFRDFKRLRVVYTPGTKMTLRLDDPAVKLEQVEYVSMNTKTANP